MNTIINTITIQNETKVSIPLGMSFMLSADGVNPIATATLESDNTLNFGGVDISAYSQVNLFLNPDNISVPSKPGVNTIPSTPHSPNDLNSSGWANDLPYGVNWVEGYYVGYAISYVNGKGESKMSPFNTPFEIGYACPIVSFQVPLEDLEAEGVFVRNLYRKISPNADLSGVDAELVVCISDNTIGSYQDRNV